MFDGLISNAHAQGLGGGGGAGAGGILSMVIPWVLIIFIFYVVLWRPQQKRNQEQQAMLASLQRGDKVVTASGIHGTIHAVEERALALEIAPNVRIRIQKESIAARLDPAKGAEAVEGSK